MAKNLISQEYIVPKLMYIPGTFALICVGVFDS